MNTLWFLWWAVYEAYECESEDNDDTNYASSIIPIEETWFDRHPKITMSLCVIVPVLLFAFTIYIGLCIGRSTWTPWNK